MGLENLGPGAHILEVSELGTIAKVEIKDENCPQPLGMARENNLSASLLEIQAMLVFVEKLRPRLLCSHFLIS